MDTSILGTRLEGALTDTPTSAFAAFAKLDIADRHRIGEYYLRRPMRNETEKDAAFAAFLVVLFTGGDPSTDLDELRKEFARIVNVGSYGAGMTSHPWWFDRSRPGARKMPERDLTDEELLALTVSDRLSRAETQGLLDAWLNQDGSNPPLDDADRKRRERGRSALRLLQREDLVEIVQELHRRYPPESIDRLIGAFAERHFQQADAIAAEAQAYLLGREDGRGVEELMYDGDDRPAHRDRLRSTREEVRLARQRYSDIRGV
jgi:hypothetical protein